MLRKFTLLAPALLALGWAFAFSPVETGRHSYFDPEDRRVHASIDAVIAGGRLHLEVSALAPAVEPLPGFRGRMGANLQTAFEIEQLIAGERLQMITFDHLGRLVSSGEVAAGERGRIPVRRLRHDGRIDFLAESDRDYLLGFVARSGGNGQHLPVGVYVTELRARGEIRLRVDFTVGLDGRGRVTDFVEVPHGEARPDQVGEQFRFVTTDGAAVGKDRAVEPPVDPDAWQARDLETKWMLYRQRRDEEPAIGVEAWVEFLLAEEDFDFLEMLALHELDAFQVYGIGERLKKADAPQWIRLTTWMRGSVRGHMSMTVDGLLMDAASKDVVASWIRVHPELAEGSLATVLGYLDGLDPKPRVVDVSRYAAPLEIDELLTALDAPDELPSLAESGARRAEAGVVYLEQVLRAIDGLVVSGQVRNDPWFGKLDALRGHPHPRVRQAALLAFTHVDAGSIPTAILDTVRDGDEVPQVREAALLAYSYGPDYEVYGVLLDAAEEPGHPVWRAAVSRLGDLGDGFALDVLKKVEAGTPDDRLLLKRTVEAIDVRLAKLAESTAAPVGLQSAQRYAWMEAAGDSHAEAYLLWLDAQLQAQPADIRQQIATQLPGGMNVAEGGGETRRETLSRASEILRRLAQRYGDEG